ncbi:MAG TPA: gas vesicle protein GvpJ [Solirubrobacteraceae bacterium]|nr:gas vesicle protein GvpJ [Solirubrobacteraceae bacterium]
MTRGPGSGYVQRSSSTGLAEVLDILLDKGLVIDVFLRVSLVGIELLTVDARIVIASVDTYLRFAEAVNRLDLGSTEESEGLPQLVEDMTSGGAQSKTRGVLEGAKEALFGSGDDDDEDDNEDESGGNGGGRSSSRSRSSSGSSRSGSSGSSSSRSRSRSTRGRQG